MLRSTSVADMVAVTVSPAATLLGTSMSTVAEPLPSSSCA
jgi:hypothetical protein